jgi:CheY-like chemotaxis protein
MSTARILLVEDDADQRTVLADVLRADGYDVVEAGDAERAIELLPRHQFDLMIADYQLTGATGSWLARVATTTARPGSLRALLVTGRDDIADSDDLKVLRKPLDMPRFLADVRQALSAAPVEATWSRGATERIAFVLYVSDSLASRRTVAALRKVLANYDESQIALTIVDLATQPAEQAEEHRIVVTPTLLKTFPAPRIWIAGEFNQPSIVTRLLEQAGVEARK